MLGLKSLSEGTGILGSLVTTVKSVTDMLPKKKKATSRQLTEAERRFFAILAVGCFFLMTYPH